jgi:hypothetical protein
MTNEEMLKVVKKSMHFLQGYFHAVSNDQGVPTPLNNLNFIIKELEVRIEKEKAEMMDAATTGVWVPLKNDNRAWQDKVIESDVTITLSNDEAWTLLYVLSSIDGHPTNSNRLHTDKIMGKLAAHGVQGELSVECVLDDDFSGNLEFPKYMIYFKRLYNANE